MKNNEKFSKTTKKSFKVNFTNLTFSIWHEIDSFCHFGWNFKETKLKLRKHDGTMNTQVEHHFRVIINEPRITCVKWMRHEIIKVMKGK